MQFFSFGILHFLTINPIPLRLTVNLFQIENYAACKVKVAGIGLSKNSKKIRDHWHFATIFGINMSDICSVYVWKYFINNEKEKVFSFFIILIKNLFYFFSTKKLWNFVWLKFYALIQTWCFRKWNKTVSYSRIETEDEFTATMEKIPDYRIREEDVSIKSWHFSNGVLERLETCFIHPLLFKKWELIFKRF